MKPSPLLLLFAFLFHAVSLAAAPDDDTAVLVVNGEPVSVDEYAMVMHRQTAGVYAHFKHTRDLDDHPGYWSPASGPDGPLAALHARTRAELVRIKVVQIEARARGLMKHLDFASFRAAYEKENTRRLAAQERNEVIYGPPQYRPDIYYFILFGDIAYKVEQAMAKELEASVTDVEIDGFLAAHEEEFKDVPPADVRLRVTEVLGLRAAQKKLEALRATAVIEVRPDVLVRLSPRSDDAAR